MKKCLTFICCLFLFQSWSVQAQDIFGGLLEKEKPAFTVNFLPGLDKGTARLSLFFTHSKMDELEVSVWVQDKGSLLDIAGKRMLVSDLQRIKNRQTDTLTITGLSDTHFYSVSIDYRNPQSISRKFSTYELENPFRYDAQEKPAIARKSPEPVQKPMVQNTPVSSVPVYQQPAPANPCKDPNILLGIEKSGYCESGNRPALLIQCTNCENRNWKFSVELRNSYEVWRPIRADGNQQTAMGNAIRREPMCLLRPGDYYARVLAWGDNCPEPIVVNYDGLISVTDKPQLPAPNPNAFVEMKESEPLPDSCQVTGQALLTGNHIQGWLYLPAYSACAYSKPVAMVRYVNPKHRDLTLEKLPLIPGAQMPFDFALDETDLERGIHTIQVVVSVTASGADEETPIESFWLKAADARSFSTSAYDQPDLAINTKPAAAPVPQKPDWGAKNANPQTNNAQPQAAGFEEEPYIDPMLEQQIQEVSVTASDPNCTPVQDLRLVFDPKNPGTPLFISWLSPRCCQESGCEYTVWSGTTPSTLKLLVKGNKPGAVISEVLNNSRSEDKYYEVVVKSPNGNRKAAYVLGEGPKYGIEAILDYQDRLKAPRSDTLVAVREKPGVVMINPNETAVPVSASWNDNTLEAKGEEAVYVYETPKYPVTDFEPCKYKRETIGLAKASTVQPGQEINLKYDFKDKDYRFTLYLLPEDVDEWVVAPGTQELQASPEFKFKATQYHSGKYAILSIKNGGTWGCLSTPLQEAVQLKVK